MFGPANLVELLQYHAKNQPNEDAFIYLANGVDDEIHLSYTELDQKARRIAAWLQQRHCFGERILLLYPPGLDFIAAYFGCLYAGAIAVPVYPPKKNRSMIRIQSVAKSAGAIIALTTDDVLQRVEQLIGEAPDLQHLKWLASTSVPENLEDTWMCPSIDPETIAFLQYTSGSTGTPKGVVLTHGNLIHNSQVIYQGFEHTRRGKGVFWLPSYHDMGLIGGIIQPLYCGRPNVIMSPLTFLQKPFRWLAAITKYRGTTCGGPNFAYDLCVRQVTDEQIDQLDLSSWKVAFNGAEPVSAETLDAFAEKFEPCGFRYEAFYPCFGLAEATLLVSGGYLDERPIIRSFDADALATGNGIDATEQTNRVSRLVSSGRNILPDQRVAIVDPESCVECSDRVVGEIWVRGPSMARGYWEAPEATEQTFHAHIAETNEGPFMRTGDLGFVIDGELFVTGRIKDLMIVRGVNIYPQDVEATAQKVDPALRPLGGAAFMVSETTHSGAHSDAHSATHIGKESAAEHLVIVQELGRSFKGDTEPLLDGIRRAISQEFEIPVVAIILVKMGSIPKTSSGKIQRHACRAGFLDGSLNELARWVSPSVSFAFTEGGVTENALDEALGTTDSVDHKRIVRGTAFTGDGSSGIVSSNAAGQSESLIETPTHTTLVTSGLTNDEIAAIVLEEVRKVAKERAAKLTLETDITELGLDSLERMEILASLEDRFGGQFPESILAELYTGKQVVDAILVHLGYGFRKPIVESTSGICISEECYNFAVFPEYIKLKQGLDFIQQTGLNRFFDVHEGITNDRALIGGKEYINFSNYNYINTSGDPEVTRAAKEACDKYGTSVSASRLVSGNKPLHRELEVAISQFLGCEDTIVLVGGHATNEGVIGHLLNEKDMILFDSLAHNSIVQGALLSGARRRPFPHNDWDAADWILKKHRKDYRRVLFAIEGVYSMDGDYPDLQKFIEVKKRHNALLMVDEAHSLGVLGKTGRGIGEHFNINRSDVDIWMCTLSKTFASCGGYISGSKALVEYLKYTAPNFVFSVGLPPSNAAAALAALRVLEREPERVEQLRQNGKFFLEYAAKYQLNTGTSKDSAVVPVILGSSILALQMSKALFERGINVQPILHPAVEEKAARLRFFITSAHTEAQIRFTVDCIAEELEKFRTISPQFSPVS
ncbi:MAG: aminotransferase class I/II-fold pyridoxal phosphate-dependent enzyme [Thermoguttaceae bacterium]